MNQYTQILYYIKSLADAEDYVSTVTNSGGLDIDDDKGNIFPIFDIFIDNASFPTNNVIRFNITLTCVDLRDTNKQETNVNKFLGNDNEPDNLNETLSALFRVWGKMNNEFNELGISSGDDPQASPLLGEGKNVYDGWSLPIVVEVPIGVTLCDGC